MGGFNYNFCGYESMYGNEPSGYYAWVFMPETLWSRS